MARSSYLADRSFSQSPRKKDDILKEGTVRGMVMEDDARPIGVSMFRS